MVSVAEEVTPNGAGVLLMGVPCTMAFARQFRHVVDLAETFDDARLEVSRERFKSYREHGFAPFMRQ